MPSRFRATRYYDWLGHVPSKREREDIHIKREILKSHSTAPTYGVDNVHTDVLEKMVYGRNRVRRLMRQMGITSMGSDMPGT